MCDNSTSTVACASFGANYELLYEYLAKYSLMVFRTSNYIDYDEVDPFKGPLKKISEVAFSVELDTLNPSSIQFKRNSFTET